MTTELLPALYRTEDGKPVSTHSMLKTFRRCPKQAEYKYVERLKPKVVSRPLKRGTWMHSLLEVHHMGGDWRAKHEELTEKFNELFEEEQEGLGDLPRECLRLMRGYLWHYGKDDFLVKEVEFTLECEFPDGSIYRGKVDGLAEWRGRMYLIDHKTHKTLPDIDFRLLDAQSALYLWAAAKNGLKVEGFIWNYVKTSGIHVPKLLKSGERLSRSKCNTDYPTLYRAIKKYGLDHDDYREWLDFLKGQRFEPGKQQTSDFFRRDVLEKSPDLLERVAAEAFHTSLRMHNYGFGDEDFPAERVVDRGCKFACSYTDLCTVELMGGNAEYLRQKRYKVGDPMDYYEDRANESPGKGDD